jgi:DNA-binding Lrp family transcriptional regulator
MDELDRAIVNALQGGFPISDEPYREVAETLGIAEAELIARLGRLLESKTLTRFGPMFQVERMGGAFVLAAQAVPEADYERIAEQVNALPEVAHNYRREHALNMWFVLATETPEGIPAAIDRIERATGLKVYAFPKLKEYFVEMKLAA